MLEKPCWIAGRPVDNQALAGVWEGLSKGLVHVGVCVG